MYCQFMSYDITCFCVDLENGFYNLNDYFSFNAMIFILAFFVNKESKDVQACFTIILLILSYDFNLNISSQITYQ